MLSAEVQSYRLSPAESDELNHLGIEVSRLLTDRRPEIRGYVAKLPDDFAQALQDFAASPHSGGVLLIRGVGVGAVPDTPTTYSSMVLGEHVTSGVLALVADALGSLVGYQDEKSGALVHEVHPVPGEEHKLENSGSITALGFHTENAHHPLRPDFLALLCLRADHLGKAATRVASIQDAVTVLDPAVLELLRSPIFYSRYPTSFTRGRTGAVRSGPHPVIFGPEDRPWMRFDSDNTEADLPAGVEALARLGGALAEVTVDVPMTPGDLVILDNYVVAHGRTSFVPRYDGRDRWLRRVYSLRSVPRWAPAVMTEPRVLPALTTLAGMF
ncbi:TauD/TfdA family dioxygenase [Actinoplanes oblitus]|uniref:TauD/TfdA family dioxygenase n=1 Tax=Actinoplanes oblitus TaxID=3040509 RepID=A0ABY8WA65_9ACTN|nr:TauD/TfdA family dioxygenase [Actinoplanes oblitus]WIM94402.1 TauD/TfdA family dioxygenase [Actinoplanes oblitus]